MNSRIIHTLAAVTLLSHHALQAALTFHDSRADFNAAHPTAITEDFGKLANTTQGFMGPLNALSSVSNLIEPGDIHPLFNFSTQSNSMFVAAAGAFTNPATAIGSNNPAADSIIAAFASPVLAFSADLFSSGEVAQPFTVRLFNGLSLVDHTSASIPAGSVGFFGVTSTTPFDRVEIRYDIDLFEIIGNVSIEVVPEPSVAFLAAPCAAALLARRARPRSRQRLAPAAAFLE